MKGANPLIWILIDGLSWKLVQQSRARTHGRSAIDRRSVASAWRAYPLLPLFPNCQTPPSLFSIFSGVDVDRHGLTGYATPAPTLTRPLAVAEAFEIWPRDVDMVWDNWAQQGITFRLCAMPFVQPARLKSALVGRTSVYDGLAIRPQVIKHGGRLSIESLSIDMWIDVRANGVALNTCIGAIEKSLWVALGQTLHIPLASDTPHGNAFRAIAVRAVRIEGQISLISFGYRAVQSQSPDKSSDAHKAYVATDLTCLYRTGQLGRRMDDGGGGEAEHLLIELMREMHESFAADIVGAVGSGDAEYVVGYYPVVDLLSHHLLKYIDPAKASALMQQVGNRLFDEVVGWVDELIMRCRKAAGRPVRCIAHSDHGMSPIHYDLFPNAFFERHGWLFYDLQGEPDTETSVAIFHPADNGLVLFNTARLARLGYDPQYLIAAWRCALPDNLRRGWEMFEYPSNQVYKDGWCGSHYLQAPQGGRLLAARSSQLVRPSRKGGDHTVCSADPWLCGILFDASSSALDPPKGNVLTLPGISHWLAANTCPSFNFTTESTMRFDSLLIDIDGTLMLKGQALPGAAEALSFVRSKGVKIQLLTNTTAKMPEDLAYELCQAGIQVEPHEIQTATTACVDYLMQHPELRCHLVVPDEIRNAFSGVVTDDVTPDLVVIADIGEAFDYNTLNRCFRMLRGGARLVALQKNLFWFDHLGERLDCGAFILGLEAAAKVDALVMGKPSSVFFETALRNLDTVASRTLVVGDDVLTDCTGARAVGAYSLLVRTGKYDPALLSAHKGDVDEVIDSIADLRNWFLEKDAHRQGT